jgi:glycosyltransferase involved in cell wall biosynthesis
MKVVFDHQAFYTQRYGGISRYICELSSRLNKLTDIDVSIIAPFHNNLHLSAMIPMGFKTIRMPPFQFRGSYRMQRAGRSMLLPFLYGINANADIIHETYYSLTPQGKASNRIITVYDMTHEIFSDYFSAEDLEITNAKKAAIGRADHVICISESTRQDMMRIFHVDEHKTSVVHLGYSLMDYDVQKIPAGLSHCRPYILYVGSRRGYKNFKKFCYAFSTSEYLKNNFDIVSFGSSSLTEAEMTYLLELGINDKVHQVCGDDIMLSLYYKGATLFVYPSLYEGFGIPPLEAMSFGCPVVCSNTSSIPEIVGRAGAYFDPNEVDSMREAMEVLICDDTRKLQLVKLGYERLKNFSWDKCADETAAIYRMVV